jgi:hypothetical protein
MRTCSFLRSSGAKSAAVTLDVVRRERRKRQDDGRLGGDYIELSSHDALRLYIYIHHTYVRYGTTLQYGVKLLGEAKGNQERAEMGRDIGKGPWGPGLERVGLVRCCRRGRRRSNARTRQGGAVLASVFAQSHHHHHHHHTTFPQGTCVELGGKAQSSRLVPKSISDRVSPARLSSSP